MTTDNSRADALTAATLADARSALYGIAKTYDDGELRAKALEAYEATFSATVEQPAAAASSAQRCAVNDAVQVLEQNWEFATAERLRDAFPVKRQADYTGVRDDSDSVTQSSQPAAAPIEYRYEGGTHWYDLGPAERMRPDFKGVYRLKAGTFPVWAGEPAPSPADERATFLSDDEYCDLQAAVQALELIASGLTYAKDHDLDGSMQKATIRDAMRHAKNALRRLNPIYHKLADTWQEARAASANETGAEGAADLEERAHLAAGQWANSNTPIAEALAYRDGFIAGARSPAMAEEAVAISDHDLSTSAGGRGYIAEFFAKRLRRHDFGRYIHERLAADFACALAQYLRDRDAIPQPAQAAIPAGYALVPRKSTEAMRDAFKKAYKGGSIWTDRIDYALEQLIDAAPQPPAQADARVGLTVEQFERIASKAAGEAARIPGATLYNAAKFACDEIRALLATPLPEPRAEVTDWQPIETVPKDGTEVVLLFADEVTLLGKTRPRVRAAAWLVDWTIPYRRDNPPTHWMPLPAAPFDAARAGEAS
ncbi:hypothetical protein C2U71_25660 [Burkholderia ubonensis]|nr:hypothetical protein C2U71_25660 [Burkholderia ubonensis]